MIERINKNACEHHVVMAWMRRVWKGTVVTLEVGEKWTQEAVQ